MLLLCSSCEEAAAVHYFQIYLTFLGGSTIKPHRETRFYAGEIQNVKEMATYSGVFFFTRVKFAREGKAVALQHHEQGSTDTNVCGEVLPSFAIVGG